MFLTQGIYDIDELAQFNLHIHTNFSGCAKEEMEFEEIIRTAKRANLEMIAITDHIYERDELPDFIENCSRLRRLRDEINPDIKILIGGEFSCYREDDYTLNGVDIETDYRLYAQNHFHVTGWQQGDDGTPEGYKEVTKRMLRNLFINKAADTIAHPFSGRYLTRAMGWPADAVGNTWSENELGDIMLEGHESGCAWEFNSSNIASDPELIKKMYHIGKEIGVVFTIGTDAHRLEAIDTNNITKELKRILRNG